jgi:hypothetical protein
VDRIVLRYIFTQIRFEGGNENKMAQDRVIWRTFVNVVKEFLNSRDFLDWPKICSALEGRTCTMKPTRQVSSTHFIKKYLPFIHVFTAVSCATHTKSFKIFKTLNRFKLYVFI